MSGSQTSTNLMSADGFLNTLGIDTHMAYTDGKYANVTQVISDLKYLGIDQVRDGITNGLDAKGNSNGSAPLSTYMAMAQAGIKFTFIVEATSNAVITTQLALINQVETTYPGSVLAIEGPNEVNNDPVTFNGLTGQQGAVAAQQALYAAVKADATLNSVPVDYFTGYTAGSTDPAATPGLANFDNQHPYPNYGEAPAFWVSRVQALTNLTATDVGKAPAVYTETGYSTDQVNTDVQEQYTLDLLMDTAQDAISQTYLYDLLDAYAPGSPQGDDGFGLFDDTGAQKPVAAAIHNLTTLLQDTGATAATFTPAKLSDTISGLPSTGNSMVIEKSNGTYDLVVWAEPAIYNVSTNVETAAPSANVTVTLQKAFGSVNVYDPASGTSAIASYSNSQSVTVAVTDHPVLIALSATAQSTSNPVLTIATPQQVASTTEVTVSGTVTDSLQTTIEVKDYSTVLGDATVSNGSWRFTTANLATGTHVFNVLATDTAGNTSTASDAAFTVASPTVYITYNSGVDSSTTTRTVSVTTPVTIGGTGSDTIVLAMAEDAYLGDAQFTVSVDGTQIGGIQTVTALHSAGLSQNFTLQGNFGAGAHMVAIDFLNDAYAIYNTGALAGDRNLYVDAITGDGVTTSENIEQNLAGTDSYTITLPATATQQLAPVVTLATAPSVAPGGTATLGTAAAGDSGDTLTVKLGSDSDFTSGSSVALINGTLIYSPGAITAANTGIDTISYTVTDSTNGLTTQETQKVTLTAPAALAIAITSQVLTQDTGSSATDDVTSNGAVTLIGTVTGASGTVVSIVDGTTVLGNASIANGKWTYATTLSAGTHSLHAVATDPAGDIVATVAEPSITVDATAPVLTIATPVQKSYNDVVTVSGTVKDTTQTTIEVKDYSTVLGDATVSNGSWSFTTGNLAAGKHVFNILATDLAGNTKTASDAAFTVVTPLYITYNTGVDSSTTTRTVSVTTPVTIGGTGSDTIVLAMAEDAYLGDAQFTVSVDGTQIGGVQTVTALQSSGAMQDFTLQGNFGAGTHTVAIDFLNDAYAFYNTGALAGNRNLYADAVTGDGVTTIENTEQNFAGTVGYKITLAAAATQQLAPVVTLATAPSVAPGGTATLGTAAAGDSGDTLTVKLGSDSDFTSGSSVALANGNLIYTPGAITAANAGTDTISYTVTDRTNGLTTAETQKIVLTAPVVTATQDNVLATVSTGTGTAQQEVDLSSPPAGTYVAVSTSGIGTNALILYNWDPATQLQDFLSAQAAGTASIIGIGDSTTSGFGSAATGWSGLSYLNEMTRALNQDGVAAQSDDFLGSQFSISNGADEDTRLTPIGYPTTSTAYDGGFTIVAGGNAIYLDGAGKGVNFQLDTPGNYNQVTLSYIDIGNGSANLTVDGVTVGSMNFGNTGQTLTQTINIPAGLHSDLTVVSSGANPVYIQGAAFSSTTNPAIQVYNAGIGGWDSSAADTSVYLGQTLKGSANGFGQTAGAVALSPSLAIVDLGINDIASAEDTTAQSLANIEQIVATLQAAGTDVIIMIPQPFGSSAYATGLPALRAGLESYSTANNVPIIDLSATYGDNEAALEAAGLKSDLLHPDATLYADIGSKLANLLSAAIQSGSSTTSVVSSAIQGDVARADSSTVIQTAAQAGALINGNGQSSTTLEITGGGTVVLNAADSGLTVKLDSPTSLTLSNMQFMTADGSIGGSVITALASNQTLIGGAGDTLVGAAAYGDLFEGSAALLNQDIIQNFGGSDQIDVTDILVSSVKGLGWAANSQGGVLTVTDGGKTAVLNLIGNESGGSFSFKSDANGGTLISYG